MSAQGNFLKMAADMVGLLLLLNKSKMSIEEIREICMSLPGTTESIKWEHHLCFSIGEKMYVITTPDEYPNSASLKVTDEDFDRLCAKKGITPARYLGRYKWIDIDDINRLDRKEWEKLLRSAYSLIAAKLPASTRKRLRLL